MIKRGSIDLGRFWNLFTTHGSEESKSELQNWISKNNLSSHMRVLARRPLR
jgi:hypothetical protein